MARATIPEPVRQLPLYLSCSQLAIRVTPFPAMLTKYWWKLLRKENAYFDVGFQCGKGPVHHSDTGYGRVW